MAEQGSGVPSAESSECNSNCILTKELDASNSGFSEETSKWLGSLETYLKVTEATCLELKPKQIGVKEAAEIYKFLRDSQVIDLNLGCNECLSGGMEDLLQFLISSKIKSLTFCQCTLSNKEFLLLIEALKNTHVTELITSVCNCVRLFDDRKRIELDSNDQEKFMSHIVESHLTRLDFQRSCVTEPLLRVVENTSVTDLKVWDINSISADVFTSLFSTLHHTSITNLELWSTNISEDGLKQLSLNLKHSNVVNLKLICIALTDAGLDILAEGLAHSKISSLDVSINQITGSNSFGRCLIDTQISNLNLHGNPIRSPSLLSLPHFLRHSSIVKLVMSNCNMGDELGQQLIKCLRFSIVTHLNLTSNHLQLLSVAELTAVLKDTALNSVDISGNWFPGELVLKLADCLKDSKLKFICVGSQDESQDPTGPSAFSTFLDKTKGTSVDMVDLSSHRLGSERLKSIAAGLANTTFTRLNLCDIRIGDGIVSFAPQLKFTTVTYLDLSINNLYDAGTEILARCIAETQIIKLVLICNSISDCGAKVLASCLKDSKLVQLDLANNEIGNEGLEALALHADGTFLKILDVRGNPGHRDLLIDRVLLENRTSVHRFVSFFKQIAPESNKNSFRFDNIYDEDVDSLLEECLQFSKTVYEQSSAASVLVVDDSLSFSMEESVKLLKEAFPRQFTAFVVNQIEASLGQRVSFLRRAEELKLTKIVELYLLHRPALMIDQDVGILHPYVYQLLHKYKQPLYNTSIEPEGKMRIIEYFTKHPDLDGAFDVIKILNSEHKKET